MGSDPFQAFSSCQGRSCLECASHTRRVGWQNPVTYPPPFGRVHPVTGAATAVEGRTTRALQAAGPRRNPHVQDDAQGVRRWPVSAAGVGSCAPRWFGPQHRMWTEAWLRLLRSLSQDALESLIELRCSAVAAAERQSQQAAIARFWTGGEVRRLLRPQTSILTPQTLST